MYASYKFGAKKRKLMWGLPQETFEQLSLSDCHYCGASPQTRNLSHNVSKALNGIDRINNEIGYTTENSVACCKVCNRANNNMPYDEFVAYLNNIVEHHGGHNIDKP